VVKGVAALLHAHGTQRLTVLFFNKQTKKHSSCFFFKEAQSAEAGRTST